MTKRKKKVVALNMPGIKPTRPKKKSLGIPTVTSVKTKKKITKKSRVKRIAKLTRYILATQPKKKAVPLRVLIYLLITTGFISAAIIGYKVHTASQLEQDISASMAMLDNLKTQATNLQAAIEEENNIAAQYRENVFRLDVYLSFVKGKWPRLYIQSIARSDIIGWGAREALTNPAYASVVRVAWENDATNEDFFRAAEAVESIYNFVTMNTEYKSDSDQFGRDEVYIPPDYMVTQIKAGDKARGDCEDKSILLITLLSRAIMDNPSLRINAGGIVVKEGIIRAPTSLVLYVVRSWQGIIPLYATWQYEFFGHGWVSLELPHPADNGKTAVVDIDPTHNIGGNPAPWSAWMKNSPEAKKIMEYGWLIDPPIPGFELWVPYPLHGYSEGYWIKYDVWRSYGVASVYGLRPSWRFPEQNARPGQLVGDPLYPYYELLKKLHGTPHPADLPDWQSYYGG